MKILLVAERYWPEVGAAPSRLTNMATALHQGGCSVDVLTALPNYPKGQIFDGYKRKLSQTETYNGIQIFRYWIYATIKRNPLARIFNMFSFAITIWFFSLKRKRIKQYDRVIIQTPTLVVAASAMVLFKKLFKKKCILNVSDIWPLTAADMGALDATSFSYKFMKKLELFLYKNADAFLGQSEEILNHIEQEILSNQGKWDSKYIKDSNEVLESQLWKHNSKLFLYRNLKISRAYHIQKGKNEPLKLVFSGMLGVAQDVLSIIKHVSFKDMNVEFHIIGGGKQLEEIKEFCNNNPNSNIFIYGFLPKEEIAEKLNNMDASIVPLAQHIRGAFPSKIFDILPQGLPILFCGSGEAASFIKNNKVGFTSEPGDYKALAANINRLQSMTPHDYEIMSKNCISTSIRLLDFDRQLQDCQRFLKEL